MNSFLLSIGVAIVLALTAVLVGPYFIDWSDYKAAVEARLGEMTGSQVAIEGDLDVRFLPSGRIQASGVEFQRGDLTFPILIAPEFSAEFSLFSFVLGNVEILELNLVQPIVSLPLDEAGNPLLGETFAEDDDQGRVVIKKITVTDGTLVVLDQEGQPIRRLTSVGFEGSAEIPGGAVKIDGGFFEGTQSYRVKIATAKPRDNGAIRTKVTFGPDDLPSALALDILVNRRDDVFHLDGEFQFLENQDSGLLGLNFPVSATGALGGSLDNLVAETIQLQVGPPGSSTKFEGSANVGVYPEPSIRAVLSGRQIDLDRIMGENPGDIVRPLDFLAGTAGLANPGPLLPFALNLSLDVDGLLVGGSLVESVVADLATEGERINVNKLSATLPGRTRFSASGSVVPGQGMTTDAIVRLGSGNGGALANWLGMDRDIFGPLLAPGQKTDIDFEGAVFVSPSGFSLQDAVVLINGDRLSGSMTIPATESDGNIVIAAQFGRLELDKYVSPEALKADRLGALAEQFVSTLVSGRNMSVELSAEFLSSGKMTARGVDIDLEVDGELLAFEQLEIEDLSGLAISARGRIGDIFDRANGRIDASVTSDDISTALTIVQSIPGLSNLSVERAKSLSPAAIELTLDATAEDEGAIINLNADADLDQTIVNLNGTFTGLLTAIDDAKVSGSLKIENPDSQALLRQAGYEVTGREQENLAATVLVSFEGRSSEAITVSASATMLDSNFLFSGSAFPAEVFSVSGDLEFDTSDVSNWAKLAGFPAGGSEAIPAKIDTQLMLSRERVEVNNARGSLGANELSANLFYAPDDVQPTLNGQIATASLSLGWLLESLVGEGTSNLEREANWPNAPFDVSAGDARMGGIAVTAEKVLAGKRVLEDADFRLAFLPDGVRIENFSANLGTADIEVNSALTHLGGGRIGVEGQVTLAGESLAEFAEAPDGTAYADGPFKLTADLSGEGRSWQAVIASLSGGGSFDAGAGRILRHDPGAFEKLRMDVDREENPLELNEDVVSARLGAYLAEGALAHQGIDAVLVVDDGAIAARNVVVQSEAVSALGDFNFELSHHMIGSRWSLAPAGADPNDPAGQMPPVVRTVSGSPADVALALDATALTNWLGVRRMEQNLAALEEAQERAANRDNEEEAPVEDENVSPIDAPASEPETTDAQTGIETLTDDDREAGEGASTQTANLGDPEDNAPENSRESASVPAEEPLPTDAASQEPETAEEPQAQSQPEADPQIGAESQSEIASEPEATPDEVETSELSDVAPEEVQVEDGATENSSIEAIVQDALEEEAETETTSQSANDAPPLEPATELPTRQQDSVPQDLGPIVVGPQPAPDPNAVIPQRSIIGEPRQPQRQRPRRQTTPGGLRAPEGGGIMN